MRKHCAAVLLMSLCACGEDNNPLPTEQELLTFFPSQELTRLTPVLKAPDDALICMLGPYSFVPGYGIGVPESIAGSRIINERLNKHGWELPGENDWGLIIAIDEETHVRSYKWHGSLRPLSSRDLEDFAKKGWHVTLPAGFKPSPCATLRSAAIFTTGPDYLLQYIILGTVDDPKP